MGGSIHNGHTLTNPPRALSLSPTCPTCITLSLYSYFISPMVLCCCVSVLQLHFTLTLPHGFSHIARINLMTLYLHYNSAWFPPTTTHKYPVLLHLHLRSTSPVLSTFQSHSPLTQSQYLQRNSVLSLHRHTHHRNSFLSLPPQFPTSTALGSQHP